ncbi:MAG: hypothetical protein HRF49_03965 [bacterium]|jgi:hypothetical protein
MQELMQNKTLMAILGIAIVAAIFTYFFSGGLSISGDDPLAGDMTAQYAQEIGAQPGAPPASAPSSGGETSAGGPPPAMGLETGMPAAPAAEPSKPSEPSEPSKPAPAKLAGEGKGINEKLLAFRKLNPDEILEEKYKDLEEKVSEPEAFAEDIGRVDPLTVVLDYIPEELRPPRSGETNEEEIIKFLQESYGYEMIDSLNIRVVEVVELGNYPIVLFTVNGRPSQGGPGAATYFNGVEIRILEADTTAVTMRLTVYGTYSTMSRTKKFISGDY